MEEDAAKWQNSMAPAPQDEQQPRAVGWAVPGCVQGTLCSPQLRVLTLAVTPGVLESSETNLV